MERRLIPHGCLYGYQSFIVLNDGALGPRLRCPLTRKVILAAGDPPYYPCHHGCVWHEADRGRSFGRKAKKS